MPKIALRESKKKKKMKMSVGESFKFLAASPYIRDMALLVVAYGISINLVEARRARWGRCSRRCAAAAALGRGACLSSGRRLCFSVARARVFLDRAC